MRFQLIFFILLFLLSCSDDDQNEDKNENGLEIEWQRTYGGSMQDIPERIIRTLDGGFVLFGSAQSVDDDLEFKSRPGPDFWLQKFDEKFEMQWQKHYGGSGEDFGKEIFQTNDGGYIMVGYSSSSDGDASKNQGFHDNWIVKVNSTGEVEWEQSFGFAGHDHSYTGLVFANDGFAIGGFLDVTLADPDEAATKTDPTLHGVGEFWVNRFNEDGSLRWRKFFGGYENDRIHSMQKTADGGILLVGISLSNDFDIKNPKGSYDIWVVKVDSDGKFLWEKSYGGSGIDESYASIRTPRQTTIIVGSTVSSNGDVSENFGVADAWVFEINDDGELLWEKTYGGSQFDVFHNIREARDGGYWLVGNSRSSDNGIKNRGENDVWLVKIDDEGNQEFQQSFGGTKIDFGADVHEHEDGSLYLLAEIESNDADIEINKGIKNYWLAKLE